MVFLFYSHFFKIHFVLLLHFSTAQRDFDSGIPNGGSAQIQGSDAVVVNNGGVGHADAFARSICTPGAFFGQSIFRPIQVSCPRVNTSSLLTLQFETGLKDHDSLSPRNSGLFWSVSASRVGSRHRPLDKVELSTDDQSFQDLDTTTTSLKCSSALSDGQNMCVTADLQYDGTSLVTGNILLTNTGQCSGQILLQAALDDQEALDNQGASSCIQAMELVETNIPIPDPTTTTYPQPRGPCLVFFLEYALEEGTARPPTVEEISNLLCRTDRFFQEIIQNKTNDWNVQSYASFLDSQFNDTDSALFPINITFASNTTNMTSGKPIDVDAIIDDYMNISLPQVVNYIENYVWDTSDDDVFSHVIGIKLRSQSRSKVEQLQAPWPRTCLPPKQDENIPIDAICTVRADARKYFQPIQMPCPNIGDRVVASFSHSVPVVNDQSQETYTNVLATAAYGSFFEETAGVQVLVEARDMPTSSTTTCPVSLTVVMGFDQGYQNAKITFDPKSKATEKEVSVTVWNELALGCNVNETLQLEVSISHPDSIYELQAPWTMAECTQDLRIDNRCHSTDTHFQPDEICTETSAVDDLGRTQRALLYPSLKVECPEEGRPSVVDLAFVMPYQDNHDQTMLQLSVAVSHDSLLVKTEGIGLDVVEGSGSCEMGQAPLSSAATSCPHWVGAASTKLCKSFTLTEFRGSIVHYNVMVWNLGGCEDSIQIEASISDRGVEYQEPGICASGLQEVLCNFSDDGNQTSDEEPAPDRGSSELDISLEGDDSDDATNYTLSLGNDPHDAGSDADLESFSEGAVVDPGNDPNTVDGPSEPNSAGGNGGNEASLSNAGNSDGSDGQSLPVNQGGETTSDVTNDSLSMEENDIEEPSRNDNPPATTPTFDGGDRDASVSGGGNAFSGQGSGSKSVSVANGLVIAVVLWNTVVRDRW